jgi:hypothetical protein
MPKTLPCAIAGFVLLLSGLVAAQDTSALLNKALDEPVKLGINDTLPRALEAITRQTGLRLEVEPVVWELLPWGQDTNIRATIENKTLRQALTLMMRKLGLTFEVKEESVQIQPMPPLRRLARRATVQELAALDLLAATPAALESDRLTLKRLLELLDRKLLDLKSDFAIENRTGDAVRQDKMVFVPRNATLMDALESLPKESGATWYPWGKNLIITTKEDRVRAQLGRTLTVRYNNLDVLQVLMELASRSGVRFDIQSGALGQLPAEARSVRALFENASVQQVLEAICGSTGLAWSIKEEAVQVTNPNVRPGGAARDPVIGILQLDIGLQVLVPQSQVPPDLREFIRHKTRKELEKMRKMMQDEGFRPATRPATEPSDKDEQL